MPIFNPIPFAQWEIDLFERFSIGKSEQYQFLTIVANYFTKWVEEESVTNIKASNIEKFMWKLISSADLQCPKPLSLTMELS